jgi:phosphatidate cytidylyltransferase
VPLIAGFLAALYWAPLPLWIGLTGLVLFLAALEWAGWRPEQSRPGFLCAAARLDQQRAVLPRLTWLNRSIPRCCSGCWRPVLLARLVKIQPPAMHLLLGVIVLVPTHLGMVALRDEIGPDLLLIVVGVVVIADSAAYFAGRQFGKHKLAPSISPGKTWEGAIGAWLAITVYAFCCFLRTRHLGLIACRKRWRCSGLLFGLSVLGDLFESTLKRQAGIKDSGKPAARAWRHLDRIDSLTAVLPAATLVLDLVEMTLHALTILGATGTIGVNTLDVVARHPDRFRVVALTGQNQIEKLAQQCRQFNPRYAVVLESDKALALQACWPARKPKCWSAWRRWNSSPACRKSIA